MNRQLIPCALALGLLAACSDESGSSDSDREESPGQKHLVRSVVPGKSGGGDRSGGRDGGGGQESRADEENASSNAYAEEHWGEAGRVENTWTREFQAAGSPEEKIAVVERKLSSGPELLAPLVRLGLQDPDERVRTEAARALSGFASAPEEVVDLVVGATHDPSSEVRILAMEMAVELSPETQLAIYEQTINGLHPEVRRMTITELGRIRSKPAFDVLVSGLRSSDPAHREQVNTEIRQLVHRRFDSYDEAREWWDGNINRFSDNMIDTGGSN